nr:hypothetical protein [Methanocalculus chunghsingensis]
MGFLISIAILALMLIVSQATLVGQTTAEGVIEFPKHEIRDLRSEVIRSVHLQTTDAILEDMRLLSLKRNHAIVSVDWRPEPNMTHPMTRVMIRYNNGVTVYEETLLV